MTWRATSARPCHSKIREVQPLWNANDFLAEVRRDVPKVLGAYLKAGSHTRPLLSSKALFSRYVCRKESSRAHYRGASCPS